jgi:phosphopantothenoylcysteine synthetase/decarboxylase
MAMPSKPIKHVIYLVVCAAPPAQSIGDLVQRLQQQNWTVCVIATPRAAGWIDSAALKEQTGYPVRHDYKQPEDPDSLPRADVIAVVPATFNTINKWVAGISDTLALGLLNEAIGLKLPVIVAPYAKTSLAAHPAFGQNLRTLSEWGITVLPNEIIRVKLAKDKLNWQPIMEALGRSGQAQTDPETV